MEMIEHEEEHGSWWEFVDGWGNHWKLVPTGDPNLPLHILWIEQGDPIITDEEAS